MKFRKTLEKKMKDVELVEKHATASSKSVFLASALIFFLNIFLVGADKNQDIAFLRILLPFSYVFFVSALIFLCIRAISRLVPEKYAKYKKILHYSIIILFLFPLLVFFIQGRSVSSL